MERLLKFDVHAVTLEITALALYLQRKGKYQMERKNHQ